MMQQHVLTNLNYPLDTVALLEASKLAKLGAKPYTDSRYPNLKFNNWNIAHFTDGYIEKIMRDFEVQGKPRFYWLEPYAQIPEHVDNGTMCSINLILTDSPAPIIINGKQFIYKQALLNTTVPHAVYNGAVERVMLKISIFDQTYTQLAKRIKYKL